MRKEELLRSEIPTALAPRTGAKVRRAPNVRIDISVNVRHLSPRKESSAVLAKDSIRVVAHIN